MATIPIEKALDAQTATGAGSTIPATRTLDHLLEITAATAGSVLVVDLEGSIDGNNWVQLGRITFSANQLTAKLGSLMISDTLTNNVRANVITNTGMGAVTAYYTPGRKVVD